MANPPVVLSIAGYDPSSGAGVTADIKTAAAFGCYAVTCITALTVQSTQGVFGVEPVAAAIVRNTLLRLRQDFAIAAVRIGMLGSGAVAEEVARFLEVQRPPNVVLDPVIRSSSGAALIEDSGLEVLRQRLLPLADLITPNVEEAAVLAGTESLPAGSRWEAAEPGIRDIAARLHGLGAKAVLITGGHLAQPTDFLSLTSGSGDLTTQAFQGERIESKSTHGTGCALATALACLLAQGADVADAVTQAKDYVRQAIQHGGSIGKGVGPVNHLFRFEN